MNEMRKAASKPIELPGDQSVSRLQLLRALSRAGQLSRAGNSSVDKDVFASRIGESIDLKISTPFFRGGCRVLDALVHSLGVSEVSTQHRAYAALTITQCRAPTGKVSCAFPTGKRVHGEKVVQGVGKIDNASRLRQEQLRCNDVVSQRPDHRAGMETLVLPSERSLASERQRRMRILLACAAYPPQGKGGGPAASESIARALRARGHDVHVITVADEETHEVRDGIDIRTMRSLNVYWNYWKRNPLYKKLAWHALENGNPRALLRMRAAIAGVRPDIVVTISCENINVATWLAARMLGIPTAHVVQSHFLLCWRGSMFHDGRNCDIQCRACRYSSAGKRLLSHLVDGVIAESRHMLDRHAEAGYFAGARQKVIPAAIDWPVRSEPRPQTDVIKVGYIGMVTPNKGVETLARSAARLGEASPFRYLIAGDGPGAYVESVSAIFPQDRFQFLGWTDPAAFYPAIDVLVVPSLWSEPFGRVCIEAFSHGAAVVAARSGALPEIVEAEKSGLTFEAGNDRELADCLRRLDEDRSLLSKLQTGALERVKHYSPQRLGLSLEEFLGGICSDRAVAAA